MVSPPDGTYTADEQLNSATGEFDLFRRCDASIMGQEDRTWFHLAASYTYHGYVFDHVDDSDTDYWVTQAQYEAAGGSCGYPNDNQPIALQPLYAVLRGVDSGYHDDIEIPDTSLAIWGVDYLGNGRTNTLHRLREGIERFLITDINNPGAASAAQTTLPAMWDNTSTFVAGFNHVPGGSNVLFMDGHVDFIKYPGTGVVSKAYAGILGCAQNP